MDEKIRYCRKCNIPNTWTKFIKKRNICKICSLKKLEKYSYKINEKSKNNIKKYAKNYYDCMTTEQKIKKIKRVNFLSKKRRIKKKLEKHIIKKHSLNVILT